MKGIFKFIVLLFLAIQVHAESLIVSGISDPVAANGIYKLQGTLYGYSYWKHETNTYYIYNDEFDKSTYWNIDTDTDDAAALFFSGVSTNTQPISETWVGNGATATTGKGAPIVGVYTGILTPEITVRGNTNIIANGTTTFNYSNNTLFGVAIANSSSITRTFSIENTGAAALAITNVSIGGTNASQFSVTQPSTSIAANTGTTTFSVTYTPKSVGPHTATITIANSDTDEGSYTFAVKGTGYASANLVVADITAPTAANGTYVYQGLLNDYPYWKHQTLGYYIYNENYQSARYWTIDDDEDGSTDDFLFYKQSDDATPLGLTSWTSTTSTSVTGSSVTGAPSITSATSEPDIEILGNTLTIVLSDASPTVFDFTSFGAVNYASDKRTRTYTIKNSGNAALTLSGTSPYVKVSGDNASDFTISSAPAASIAAGSSTTFTVSFDPSATGTRSALLTIASNDADEASYTFVINGEGYTAQDLAVSGITTPAAANGKYLHQGTLNEFQYWKHESADYWIYNTPYQNARYWQIDMNQNADTAFFYSNTSEQSTPIPATSWSSGTVKVSGVEVKGAGTPKIQFASVEINVTGNSQSIDDGDITPTTLNYTDFGNANVSTSVIRTFTIQNTGSLALNLTGTPIVAISGTHASEFVVTQPSAATVTPSGTATFTVAFTPQGGGLRSAALSIANNDGDENPYNFSIQGTGLVAPTVTTEAITAIATTTATGNGTLANLGEPATVTAYGVCWSTSSNPTTTSSKASLSSTTATGAFTASITSLTPGTLYYVRAFATNATGTSYGAEQTFTAAVPNLSVATATVAIAQTAGSTAQASLSANIGWTASSDQAWLAVAPTSGTGDATLTFTAQANPLASTRSATVTVTGTGVTAKTITITQAAGAATLAVSPSITSLAKTAGSTSATVTSNTDWTAQSDQTWLTLSAASGAGDATLTLTATANPTVAERTATITLKATSVTDQTITITQAAGDAVLTVSTPVVRLDKTVDSETIYITSNTAWGAASDQTWLSIASGTGSTNDGFVATATANPTIAERTAIVTIAATGISTPTTVTITQAAGDATLAVSQNALNMGKEAGSKSVNVTSNSDWAANSDQTWLTVSSTSGTGDATLTFTAEANAMDAERSATITLKTTNAQDQVITVVQAGNATLTLTSNSLDMAKTAGTEDVDITSNTTWAATSGQTWLTVTPASGTGDATLTLSAEANATTTERTAIVTLKATGLTDRTITVTQAAGDATLAVAPTTASFTSKAGSASATVTSNTAWTAASNQTWLTLSAASGTGDATLTLTVTANTSASPRTATITLKATGAADRTIAVTQSAATTGVEQLASHLPTLSLLRSSGAALELGLCNFEHSSLTLELYALDGRKALARSLGNLGNGIQNVSVDWSMLPAGTYLVTLKGNGQAIVNLQVMKRP